MKVYIFDTDVLTLFRKGDPTIIAKSRTISDELIVTTVITVEEQISGWYTAIRQAKSATFWRRIKSLFETPTIGRATRLRVLHRAIKIPFFTAVF